MKKLKGIKKAIGEAKTCCDYVIYMDFNTLEVWCGDYVSAGSYIVYSDENIGIVKSGTGERHIYGFDNLTMKSLTDLCNKELEDYELLMID